jgi:hypothetical protein
MLYTIWRKKVALDADHYRVPDTYISEAGVVLDLPLHGRPVTGDPV